MTLRSRRPIANIVFPLAAGMAIASHVAGQTATGSISGKVITEAGQPLAGVTAVCRRSRTYIADSHLHLRPAPGGLAVAAAVTTRADGTFSTSLPAGGYALCIDSPPDGYVDHCAWNLTPVYFTVVNGTTTVIKPTTMIAGVRIHFLITDAQGVLPSAGRIEPVASVGVTTAHNTYKPATVSTRSGVVTEMVVTVPHTLPVSMSLFSQTLKFASPSGGPASAASINVTQGATDINIPLTVSK